MNKFKKAKPKRWLSLLLTVVILLGTMPFAALPVGAAPDWITISGANDSSKMQQLKGMLSQSGTKYIKLGEDINLNYDLGSAFPINGVKHLDLNGHKINYDDRVAESRVMFSVKSGAEMYIYDSSAKKTGYIHYDGILPKGKEIHHTIFFVEGGKLVVNGGEIEAGRSKRVWLVAARGFYNGYVRQQVEGAAIYVAPGAECIINGGIIRGRGRGRNFFDDADDRQWIITQDVKIHLLGDINGDGDVTEKDGTRINWHLDESRYLTDYEFKCADINGDGDVTEKDSTRINWHLDESRYLW